MSKSVFVPIKICQKRYGIVSDDFKMIEPIVKDVLSLEGTKEERVNEWKKHIKDKEVNYDPQIWEDEKDSFDEHKTSKEGIKSNIYRFHQAVAYHRYYILKDLLPKHGIAVY